MSETPRVPDRWVEMLALGELPEAEAADVRRRLEAEPGGLDRLEAIRRSNAEILATYPPRVIAAGVGARARAPVAGRRAAWALVPALAALALIMVWSRPPDDGVRLKGDATVLVHRQTATGSEPMAADARAAAGDVLRLGYQAGEARHGVLLSVDGRGEVTLHQPSTPTGSTRLEPGGPHFLPFAYELDDAPSHERFFLVSGPEPVDVEAVKAAVARLGADPDAPLAVGPGLRVHELRVRKTNGPKGATP